MTFLAWDWGALAVNLIFLGIGVLVGAWIMALMAISADCARAEEVAARTLAKPKEGNLD